MQKVLSVGLALPFVALFGAILLGGCPGELENPDRFKTDGGGGGSACFDVPTDLFVKRCANTANCHSKAMPANPPNLDLESPGVEDRLVNKMGSATCPGVLVNPADPEGSILYKKLTKSPGCGSQMPLVPPYLDEGEVACVKQWIESLGAGGAGAGTGGMGGMGVGGSMGGMGGSMGGMGGAMGGMGGM